MKTVSYAVNKIYDLLSGQGIDTFKGEKPAQVTLSQYVTIQPLPVTGDVLQTLRINVNYYVKDLAESAPDNKTMESKASQLTALLCLVDDPAMGVYISIESQNIEKGAAGFHFVNVRLLVRILNKN